MRNIEHQQEYKLTSIPREISVNLQHNLFDRESSIKRRNWLCNKPSWHYVHERQFYRSIRPNLTVSNVNKLNIMLMKFTPDGKYLLGFNGSRKSIVLYSYNGVAKAYTFLHRIRSDHICASYRGTNDTLSYLFDTLFTFKMTIPIIKHNGTLHRNFSIFINNGQYVLVGSCTPVYDSPPPTFYVDYPDMNTECELFDTTLYLVDLKTYQIADQYDIRKDSIQLSPNHGVSVCENKIVIFSNLRQSVIILHVKLGKLQYLYEIGPYADEVSCYDVQQVINAHSLTRPLGSLPFSHFKQKIFTHLFCKTHQGTEKDIANRLKLFCAEFREYEEMVMVGVQIIDNWTLVLRYNVNDKTSDNKFRLYVFYCLKKQSVVMTFKTNSIEFKNFMSQHFDNFNKTYGTHENNHSLPIMKDKDCYNLFKRVLGSFNEGLTEAPKMLNAGLMPMAIQSFVNSPFFDYSNFLYAELMLSNLEKPSLSQMELTIPFFDRHLQRLSFKLYLGSGFRGLEFHPYEPIALSFTEQELKFNIHLHNPKTIV